MGRAPRVLLSTSPASECVSNDLLYNMSIQEVGMIRGQRWHTREGIAGGECGVCVCV